MVSGATTIDELLAACDAEALARLDPVAFADFAESVLTLWSRLEAARLRLIAAADARQAFRADGCRDTASWLAWKSGERRATSHRDVALAATVADMPAVAAAMADGALSKAKAAELARASGASATDQEALVDAARALSPEHVARRIDRWQLENTASPPEVVESLTVTPTPGGGRIEATLDSEGL